MGWEGGGDEREWEREGKTWRHKGRSVKKKVFKKDIIEKRGGELWTKPVEGVTVLFYDLRLE